MWILIGFFFVNIGLGILVYSTVEDVDSKLDEIDRRLTVVERRLSINDHRDCIETPDQYPLPPRETYTM